ncbi:hypothetical protein [Rugamonas rivuli]|uniref:Uncharacterized protein n=1 Tax=Rugamonas rivuli TaxID=2743358 RepID=A0A843SLF9_9BURK|nr:hypothetical protein [Rugamonas rivuli]MQA21607.1 hypothetical protein [Rugamonas rivuli]
MSNALCAGAIVLSALLASRTISMSWLPAFPMYVGIISLGATLEYRRQKKANKWNGVVPRPLRYMLPAMALFGAAAIVFGFTGILPDASPSGEPVHHLNAYFESGLCYAVFNKAEAVQMPTEFCENFETHFASAFSGSWLLLSAVLNWASWKCQAEDVVA